VSQEPAATRFSLFLSISNNVLDVITVIFFIFSVKVKQEKEICISSVVYQDSLHLQKEQNFIFLYFFHLDVLT